MKRYRSTKDQKKKMRAPKFRQNCPRISLNEHNFKVPRTVPSFSILQSYFSHHVFPCSPQILRSRSFLSRFSYDLLMLVPDLIVVILSSRGDQPTGGLFFVEWRFPSIFFTETATDWWFELHRFYTFHPKFGMISGKYVSNGLSKHQKEACDNNKTHIEDWTLPLLGGIKIQQTTGSPFWVRTQCSAVATFRRTRRLPAGSLPSDVSAPGPQTRSFYRFTFLLPSLFGNKS